MQRNTDIFEKLNNHRLPIDESYWAEMEKRLLSDRKKVVPLWAWLAGTGIAASLALLVVVQVFNGDDESVWTQMVQVEYKEDKEIKENKENKEQAVGTQMTQIAQISADKEKSVKSVQSTPSLSSLPSLISLSSLPSLDDEHETPATLAQDTTPQKQYEQKPRYNDFLIAQNQHQPEKAPKKNKKPWQIAVAFGSGASNSGDDHAFLNDNLAYSYNSNTDLSQELNPGLPPYNKNWDPDRGIDSGIVTMNPSKPKPNLNSPSLFIPEFPPNSDNTAKNPTPPPLEEIFQSFSEVIHLPPLSFGLTVRKNFNQYLAIETGLTYTFLQSKFRENSEWRSRDATLRLHYLGIPLNAVAYLINKPQWNIYFSLGGMVEKGLMQDYDQHTSYKYPENYHYLYNDQPAYDISLQDDIPGLQWSLNTSFGIGYKLYRDFSIYFEPRIIYYFKNNQPVSVRTETPLQVGLNAGLRFEF
jgi:hypothetical protein